MVLIRVLRKIVSTTLVGSLLLSCSSSGRMGGLPSRMLWAWERPEDLRALDTRKAGVAYLAWTFTIRGDEVVVYPRRQALLIPPETVLLAVARIEVEHGRPFRAGKIQRDRILDGILRALRPEARGLQ